ncbi:hypothetical protein [Zavarzinia sp.]|uniref:hypothetical protein n=1 Tax=Zavarzinia sp. TaxID=2027920 RepID=UPI0035657AD9
MSRLALIVAALAFAGQAVAATPGPHGRYGLDVEATYANLEAIKAGSPKAKELLQQTKDLLVFEFQADRVTFLVHDNAGKEQSTGTCRWRLQQDAVTLDQCQAGGGPFAFDGKMTYDAGGDILSVQGKGAPAAAVYRPK